MLNTEGKGKFNYSHLMQSRRVPFSSVVVYELQAAEVTGMVKRRRLTEPGPGTQRASVLQGPRSLDLLRFNDALVPNNHLQLFKIESLRAIPCHCPQLLWRLCSSRQDVSCIWSPTVPCKSPRLMGTGACGEEGSRSQMIHCQ